MSEPPKFHLRDQQAVALIRPISQALRVLEERSAHYLERMILAPQDEEILRAVHTRLMSAAEDIERLERAAVDHCAAGEPDDD